MKKIYVAIAIFTVLTLLSSMVFAAVTTKFEVVSEDSCIIKINDYCTFKKSLVDKNIEKRQVTIQLEITNDSKANVPDGEIMLVLDYSNSMTEPVSEGSSETRGDTVYGAAKSLVTKILTNSTNAKIGIVKFSTKAATDEATIDDASLVSELTDNKDNLISAINAIDKTGIRTNLDSGLTLASKHFTSANNNKYIIVLTDGVPNVAIGENNPYYGDAIINKTKSTLQEVGSKYSVITMLTGISTPDYKPNGIDYTFSEIIERVFGTTSNPTTGKFYYITDDQINKTVNDDIYENLLAKPQSIKDIRINDFFPKEIVDNFDFAYVSKPSKGTITESIDSENKIVWSIDELSSGEKATVQYTLTLKDNYSEDIVGVILDTNEKVVIDYKDFDDTEKSKTGDETPKVRITQNKPKDPTVVPTIIPKTGSTTIISSIAVLVIFTSISGIRLLKINKDIKKQ